MPGTSGDELIRRVRESGCNVPARAITATVHAGDRASSLAAGFQMHLSKPIEPYVLVVSIANLTGRLKDGQCANLTAQKQFTIELSLVSHGREMEILQVFLADAVDVFRCNSVDF